VTKPPALSKYVQVDASSARLSRIWATVSSRLESRPRAPRRFRYSLAAAALFVIGATVITWRLSMRAPTAFAFRNAALETAGDSLTVDYDDGSRLELAARTRLEVLAGDSHSAAVRLKRGSVVCDLASLPGRQFSVFAEGVEVRVTGTRFTVNLNAETNQIEVSVQRGSVMVVWPEGSTANRRLAAGEHWSIDRRQQQSALAESATRDHASAVALPNVDAGADGVPSKGLGAAGDQTPAEVPPAAADLPSARSLLDQGNAARRAGDARGAAHAYQNLLAKFPSDPRAGLAAFELGRLRMGTLSDIPGAVRAFQSAAALSPGSAIREDAMAHLVEVYAISGQSALCESARDAYLKSYPSGVHAALVGRQCAKNEHAN